MDFFSLKDSTFTFTLFLLTLFLRLRKVVRHPFSLLFFQNFFLIFDFLQFDYNILRCIWFVFFVFVLFFDNCPAWCSQSFLDVWFRLICWNSQSLLISNIASISFLSFWCPHYRCYTFCSCPTALGFWGFFFQPFSFNFSVLEVSLTIVQTQRFSPQPCLIY